MFRIKILSADGSTVGYLDVIWSAGVGVPIKPEFKHQVKPMTEEFADEAISMFGHRGTLVKEQV
jgi:hypothetical protein